MKITLTFHNSLLKYTTGIKTHTVVCDDFDSLISAVCNLFPKFGEYIKKIQTENISENLCLLDKDKKLIKSEIYHSSQMVKLINDSYFSIVLEAYFENPSLKQTYVTEKSFRPIFSKRPFIIVGQRGALRGLKERGYKTFHPFINEEYDNEKDPIQRYFKVLFEINKLCKLSIEELHNFMEPLKEIIEYNYNHFYERIEFEKQYLKDLINENT